MSNNGKIKTLSFARALRLRDELVAKLTEAGEALLSRMRDVLLQVAELAEAAAGLLPLDTVFYDEDTGTISFEAKPGEFGLFATRIAENADGLATLSAGLEAANGQLELRASREEFEAATAVGRLREAVSMTAAEAAVEGAVLTLPLEEGVGSRLLRNEALGVRASDGAGGTAVVVCLVAEDAGPNETDVLVFPQAIEAESGATVYLPAREWRANVLARFDLFEVGLQSGFSGGTALVGRLAADVPAGTVSGLPLESCLFGVFADETVRIATAEGPLTLTVEADLLEDTEPVTLDVDSAEVPFLPKGTEVRLTEQTMSSILRRTAGGGTSIITSADLDPANGARVIAALDGDVDGTAVDALSVTAVDRDGDGTLVAPTVLVVRTPDRFFSVILSEDLPEGATSIAIDQATITALAGAEVIEPAESALNRVLESAGRYARTIAASIADGSGLVTRTEFEQTTSTIRAIAEAGDVRSLFQITPTVAQLLGGRSLVLAAGKTIDIGSATIADNQIQYGGALDIATQGGPLSITGANGTTISAGAGSTVNVNRQLRANAGLNVTGTSYLQGVETSGALNVGTFLSVDGQPVEGGGTTTLYLMRSDGTPVTIAFKNGSFKTAS